MKETNDRAELDALRQLPPEAVAGLLGLTHDQAAQRRHGGAGYSYWRMPDGTLITLRMGRSCWIWHPTQRDGDGGGDWLALYQHLHPAASLGHARRALRQALAGGQAAPARASAHLLAPQAAATATVAPARPLQLCDAPAWGIDYLHRERGIPMPTLEWALAMRAIRSHKPGYQPDPKAIHLAFPHTQRDGEATWAELRGPVEAHGARSKKASRGFKGLWILPPATESRVMVVTESAIKCLALHARLAQANRQAWIASTGGDPGKHQQQMLAWLVDELGIETTALAQDSDTPGQRQADRLAAALGTHAHKIVRMPPPGGFVGWDDWAMAQRG
jgi:hypothetical protein